MNFLVINPGQYAKEIVRYLDDGSINYSRTNLMGRSGLVIYGHEAEGFVKRWVFNNALYSYLRVVDGVCSFVYYADEFEVGPLQALGPDDNRIYWFELDGIKHAPEETA